MHPVVPWALALLPFVLLAALHFPFGAPLESGDQAHYMMHARALAEGRPYTETGYIRTEYAPFVGPAAYPPGFPVTLAPVVALLGDNIAAMKLIVAVSMALGALAAGWYFARREGPWIGAGVTMLFAVALEMTHAINSPAADPGFIALVWLLILLAGRPGPWSAGRIVGVTLLGFAAVSYRLAGVALGPALVLYGVLRWRDLGIRPFVPALVWLAAALVVAVVASLESALGAVHLLDPRLLHRHFGTFVILYRHAILEAHLYPFPWPAVNDVYHIVSIPLALVGIAAWLRTEWRSFLASFGLAYVLMLMLVPVKDGRYLLPLAPLLIFGLLNGIRVVAGLFLRRSLRWRPAGIATAAAGVIAVTAMLTHWPMPKQVGLAEVPASRALFGYLRERHAREPLRVVFGNPRLLTWETRIPAMATFEASPAQSVAELRARRISHVVLDDLGLLPPADSSMRAMIATHRRDFELEYENAHYVVYRVGGSPTRSPDP